MSGVFISHSHNDEALARALATLIETLFKGKFPAVNYSSRKELEGGISPGEDWFRWIVKQVRDADVSVILLTPNSVMKPWVLWEAGAVAGAAFSSEEEQNERRLYPLSFGLGADSVPGPFSRTQVVKATERAEIDKLIEDLYKMYEDKFSSNEGRSFGAAQAQAVNNYLASIEKVLPRLPVSVTEAAVQEWLDRLDNLASAKRFTEVGVLEDWIDVAFGREASDRDRPLDVRLHRRLADVYASAGQARNAVRQYDLARRTAPRDIFVLRSLGKAKLDIEDLEGCRKVIEEVESLDEAAFEKNPENAALKARWQRLSGDNIGEQETLRKAYKRNTKSYYIGDLLGQALVRSGEVGPAKEIYRQVNESLVEVGEDNVWAAATGLTAAIVLGNAALVDDALSRIQAFSPSPEERTSIRGGLQQIVAKSGVDDSIRSKLSEQHWL